MARRSFKTQMKSFYKLDNTESIKSNCKSYINPYIHLRSNPSSRGKSLQLSYLCLKTLLQSPLKSSQEVKLWGFKLSEANKKTKTLSYLLFFFLSTTSYSFLLPTFDLSSLCPPLQVCYTTLEKLYLPSLLNIPECLSAACCFSFTMYHPASSPFPVGFLNAI